MFRTRIRILIVATLLATVTIISCALYFLADAIVTGAMKERVMSLASGVSAGMDKNRISQLAGEKKPRREQADFIYFNQVLQKTIRDTASFTNPIVGASILLFSSIWVVMLCFCKWLAATATNMDMVS